MSEPADRRASALSAAQLADYLGVTSETVRRKAASGEIPGMRVGRLWRFDLDEVKAALKPSTDLWAQPPRSRHARRRS